MKKRQEHHTERFLKWKKIVQNSVSSSNKFNIIIRIIEYRYSNVNIKSLHKNQIRYKKSVLLKIIFKCKQKCVSLNQKTSGFCSRDRCPSRIRYDPLGGCMHLKAIIINYWIQKVILSGDLVCTYVTINWLLLSVIAYIFSMFNITP